MKPLSGTQCSCVLQEKEGELIKATGVRPGAAKQKWVSPANLTSLLQEVRRAKSNGQSVRLVGGNTGPGVYKDWPVDVDVLVGTTGVPELNSVRSREVCAVRRLVSSLCMSGSLLEASCVGQGVSIYLLLPGICAAG